MEYKRRILTVYGRSIPVAMRKISFFNKPLQRHLKWLLRAKAACIIMGTYMNWNRPPLSYNVTGFNTQWNQKVYILVPGTEHSNNAIHRKQSPLGTSPWLVLLESDLSVSLWAYWHPKSATEAGLLTSG